MFLYRTPNSRRAMISYFGLIDGFHSDVIKFSSQNSQVLRILIYTRLTIKKK